MESGLNQNEHFWGLFHMSPSSGFSGCRCPVTLCTLAAKVNITRVIILSNCKQWFAVDYCLRFKDNKNQWLATVKIF